MRTHARTHSLQMCRIYLTVSLLCCSFPDKCPALDDFVAQIKGSSETSQLFESVQADAVMSISSSGAIGMEPMELS